VALIYSALSLTAVVHGEGARQAVVSMMKLETAADFQALLSSSKSDRDGKNRNGHQSHQRTWPAAGLAFFHATFLEQAKGTQSTHVLAYRNDLHYMSRASGLILPVLISHASMHQRINTSTHQIVHRN
jgi:hypothetical protein